jgi:hypothetical protein
MTQKSDPFSHHFGSLELICNLVLGIWCLAEPLLHEKQWRRMFPQKAKKKGETPCLALL